MRKGANPYSYGKSDVGDVLGHAADVWGQRAMSSCPAATAMILPIANDLVLRKGLGVTVDSFSAQSRRDENPSRTGRAARARWISSARLAGMGVRSIARTG